MRTSLTRRGLIQSTALATLAPPIRHSTTAPEPSIEAMVDRLIRVGNALDHATPALEQQRISWERFQAIFEEWRQADNAVVAFMESRGLRFIEAETAYVFLMSPAFCPGQAMGDEAPFAAVARKDCQVLRV